MGLVEGDAFDAAAFASSGGLALPRPMTPCFGWGKHGCSLPDMPLGCYGSPQNAEITKFQECGTFMNAVEMVQAVAGPGSAKLIAAEFATNLRHHLPSNSLVQPERSTLQMDQTFGSTRLHLRSPGAEKEHPGRKEVILSQGESL